MDRQDYPQRLAAIDAAVAAARRPPDVVVAQAAGLLAGRVGCPVSEAHGFLARLASDERRAPHEVAADLLTALDSQADASPDELRAAVDRALRHGRPGEPGESTEPGDPAWARTMQQVLDALPGRHTVMTPLRDASGEVHDYVFAAVSPSIVDRSGRRGEQIVGHRLSEAYPAIVDGPIWHAWRETLDDGLAREVGPIPYAGDVDTTPAAMRITVRVHPVGPGLLNSWIRHDEQERLADRIAQTERLGHLGWGEADLVTGEVEWSEELYRIFDRDPAMGPLSRAEQDALTVPEDQPVRRRAAEAFGRGETVDITYRIRVGGRTKYIRTVIDAVRDVHGRPLRLYGIVQDVTGREISRARLARVEQQLRKHQQDLATEHQFAVELQQIVLPIPAEPIDLPGLRVAVRYLPAEQASRVGGDWYHATATDDGQVMMAIGDVAGHGIRAASVMAQLRYVLDGLIVTTTTEPADLLEHLNRLLYAGGTAVNTATAIVARYDPATRTVTWAQAGHPPPLRTRAGVTTELRRPAGQLLGATPTARYDTATLTLDLGDLLLLYTDGLIEHRDRTLDEGLAPVIATLNRISAAGSQQPLADLLARMRRANPNDDTCIVAVRSLAASDGHG